MKRRTPGVSVLRLNYPADEGSQEVWFGEARVVVKIPEIEQPPSTLVAVEFVCTRLAMALGVPVPMGDAGQLPDERSAWVSAQVEYDGQVFPPADLVQAAAERPWDVAAMAVFDVWVNNGDRHDGNVIYHPEVGLWAIDFEQSLGAELAGDAGYHEGMKNEVPRLWCLDGIDLERKFFRPWVERVEQFPKAGLEAVLTEARQRDLLSTAQSAAIAKFLKYRQREIRALLVRSLRWTATGDEKEDELWPTLPELGT